jgi:DNA-binding CsgD family transcriptional regulator
MPTPDLSPKELQILGFIAQGKRTSEMAKITKNKSATIAHQRASLFLKLDAHTGGQAVNAAWEQGILKRGN